MVKIQGEGFYGAFTDTKTVMTLVLGEPDASIDLVKKNILRALDLEPHGPRVLPLSQKP